MNDPLYKVGEDVVLERGLRRELVTVDGYSFPDSAEGDRINLYRVLHRDGIYSYWHTEESLSKV